MVQEQHGQQMQAMAERHQQALQAKDQALALLHEQHAVVRHDKQAVTNDLGVAHKSVAELEVRLQTAHAETTSTKSLNAEYQKAHAELVSEHYQAPLNLNELVALRKKAANLEGQVAASSAECDALKTQNTQLHKANKDLFDEFYDNAVDTAIASESQLQNGTGCEAEGPATHHPVVAGREIKGIVRRLAVEYKSLRREHVRAVDEIQRLHQESGKIAATTKDTQQLLVQLQVAHEVGAP